MSTNTTKIRLMTYNIGGGRKAATHHGDASSLAAIMRVVRELAPDILALQEATVLVDADGKINDIPARIAEDAGYGDQYAFGPTLSRNNQMHIRKALFIRSIFRDEQEWAQGNALFSRWRMVRLGNPSLPGKAFNLPLFRPPLYEGTRDTDPRYALLARIDLAPVYPYVLCTHFTTLVNQRTSRNPDLLNASERQTMRERFEEASMIRHRQARMVLELLQEHVLDNGKMVFLMGDLNALASEMCISDMLINQGGFIHLNFQNPEKATHPKTVGAVDHILAFPRQRLVSYTCQAVETPDCEEASDHLPVVADVEIDLS